MSADRKWLLAAYFRCELLKLKANVLLEERSCMSLQLVIRLYERSLQIHAPQFGFSVTLNVCWHFLKTLLKKISEDLLDV